MSPRVIYTHGGGRLGNQVLRFVHWAAWAHEYNGEVEVLDFAFWPYARYFEVWKNSPGCVFPPRSGPADSIASLWARLPSWIRGVLEASSRASRMVQAAGHWWPGAQAVELDIAHDERLDLDGDFLTKVRRRAVTMCCGWRISNWDLVCKHESLLRQLFRPEGMAALRAEKCFRSLRSNADDLVIGVFIRQSDYREWYDGRFLFAAAQYAEWMRQLLGLYGSKRIKFLIASEVAHDPETFAGLPIHFASGTPNAGGHWIDSWVELSLCDYIISPPSTFSATAAFLGRVPLWPLVSPEQTMSFAQVLDRSLIDAARHPEFSLSVK